MKHRIFLVLSMIVAGRAAIAQDSIAINYMPYFNAVIVSNINASKQWYQSVFGLKIKNEMGDSASGYKVVILESSSYLLELLELSGSLNPKKILEGKPEGTKIQGHFKIGYKVTDMDKCLSHLAALKIPVPRVWTDSASRKRNFLVTDHDGNLIQFFE